MTIEISQKITHKSLNENRRYFYVVILFLSACLTDSPNYISQLTCSRSNDIFVRSLYSYDEEI